MRIKITDSSAGYVDEEAIGKVHFVNPNGDGEQTLCSIAFVDELFKNTKEKVDCKMCLKNFKELKVFIKKEDSKT